MSWYKKIRHSSEAYWVVMAIICVELIIGYGIVLGFWFTGPYR